jgi:mono/diheme cytochrome c family protein
MTAAIVALGIGGLAWSAATLLSAQRSDEPHLVVMAPVPQPSVTHRSDRTTSKPADRPTQRPVVEVAKKEVMSEAQQPIQSAPDWAGEERVWNQPTTVLAEGRELFFREWQPNDPRSYRGDGLGPMFNDSSCVACHNLGAPGGGGPNSKNVDILSAGSSSGSQAGCGPMGEPITRQSPALVAIHPGFRSSPSIVLHRFGTNPGYDLWRLALLASISDAPHAPGIDDLRTMGPDNLARLEVSHGRLSLPSRFETTQGRRRPSRPPAGLVSRSQRNPTALFGAGQLDSIPEHVLEAASQKSFPEFPEIKGRLSRLANGRFGRFGWKAQTASLDDFVLTACAVEVGLEAAHHAQGGNPMSPLEKPAGADLSASECDSLVAFVRSLPAPTQQHSTQPKGEDTVKAGKTLFASIGCATCHQERLGDVDSVYSDLLLHDMGSDTADTGQYSPFRPPSFGSGEPIAGVPGTPPGTIIGATRQEWRTPPLWGVRDSGPYMHDGRAETLEQAIALHGGQGAGPAGRYAGLSPQGRTQVLMFLKSLVAPTESVAQAPEATD